MSVKVKWKNFVILGSCNMDISPNSARLTFVSMYCVALIEKWRIKGMNTS